MQRLFLTVAFALFAACPSAADSFLASGSGYLAQSSSLRAEPGSWLTIDSSNASSYDGRTLDICGKLSGTIGSGATLCVLLAGERASHAISFGDAQLPPLGSEIRVLARVMPTGSAGGLGRLRLVIWAFASDVARARAAGGAAKVKASAAAASRFAGVSVSRGSFNHLQYFDAYRSSIKSINPNLRDSDLDSITGVLLKTSTNYDVDPRLIMAIVLAESGFRPSATSPKGAMGLAQLMPRTAQAMGLSDPYEPAANLDACIKIIRSSLDKYSNKAHWKDLTWNQLKLALAAYNAGSGAVKRHGGVPPYRETQRYIAKVSAYYKQLCGQQ